MRQNLFSGMTMTISQNLVLERRVKGTQTVKISEGDIY